MRLRAAALATLAILAGCGGGGPKSDADAVAQVLKDAAKAFAEGDAGKACGYLTPDAQRQAVLQTGAGALGTTDCATAVGRVQIILSPLDRQRIKSLEPANIRLNGASASAMLASSAGAPPGQGISVQLNLQKVGDDWKISGFVSAQGVPGG